MGLLTYDLYREYSECYEALFRCNCNDDRNLSFSFFFGFYFLFFYLFICNPYLVKVFKCLNFNF